MELKVKGRDESPGFIETIFRPRTESHEEPAMINDPTWDPYKRASVTVSPSSVGGRVSTADKSCMDTINYWLDACFKNHKLCQNSLAHQQSKRLPTRLIDLEGASEPRLLLTQDIRTESRAIRYATLSHRWSKERHLMLLQDNIEQLQKRIDVESLPLVFRDTITVLENLRIRYLWIDCLCILQDSPEDWERESSVMGQVYQNAYCNVGALKAASDARMGDYWSSRGYSGQPLQLFTERNPYSVFPTAIELVRKGRSDTEFFAYSRAIEQGLNQMALMRRGWVFQERLLSPRSVYFGSQLTWECAEVVACEAFPDGVPVQPFLNTFTVGMPVRLSTMLRSAETDTEHRTALYDMWLKLVQEYSQCELSYATDMFPALSGLAKAFAQSLQDEYIAGFWRKDMLRGLLWITSNDQPRPEEYIAPSWSWASNREVMFLDLFEPPDERFQTRICQFNDAQISLHGSDPMGRVLSGQITLTGHMTKTQTKKRKSEDSDRFASFDDYMDYYDSVEFQNDASLPECTHHFVVACHAARRQVFGLILEPTSTKDEFRRIGIFKHPFGHADGVITYDPWERARTVVLENFPEFASFDPDSLEKQTVTII